LNVDEALDHDWISENTGTILRIQAPRRPSNEASPSDAVILVSQVAQEIVATSLY
jgi:hypothetical protein